MQISYRNTYLPLLLERIVAYLLLITKYAQICIGRNSGFTLPNLDETN